MRVFENRRVMSAQAPLSTWQVAEAVLQSPRQRGRLMAYARVRFGIQAADAEDLVQETAVELLRRPAAVQVPEAFVFTVFRSRCLRYRADRRRRLEGAAADPALCESAASPGSPEGTDRRLALRQAFQEISSSCRRILSAYYIEGRSLAEAARAVALAVSGGTKTISRCLKRLRACLT
jgi:RNA polymerase sigma factor (sigma-70 family)